MFGKQKDYILNTRHISAEQLDIAGSEAVYSGELLAAGVNMPDSFILTAVAFEDFITAANLTDPIAEALEGVTISDPSTIQLASQTIGDLISQANFPSIVLSPLVQAYKSVSGFTDKFVTIRPSWVLEENLHPRDVAENILQSIKGEPGMLYAVKQVWSSLFSEDAIYQRLNASYQGPLSIAVMVQREVHAEVSGKVFTQDLLGGEENLILIEAVLGMDITDPEIQPDIYKVDKNDLLVREKNIVSQDQMILRKGRAQPGEEATIKVPISTPWRKKQKLGDAHILQLAQTAAKLQEYYQDDLELRWVLEADTLYITAALELEVPTIEDGESLLTQGLADIAPQVIAEPPVAAEQVEAKDVQELALEIEGMVEEGIVSEEELPEVLEFEEGEVDLHLQSLVTDFILDVSDSGAQQLADVQKFRGAYFDSTKLLLRHQTLPETLEKQSQKLSNLIERFALEISNVAKATEPYSLYYSFSNISPADYPKFSQDKNSGVLTGLDGAERFLFHPESLLTEIYAVRKAINSYGAGAINLILPALRSEQELIDLKKILHTGQIKRSKSMELYAEIAMPTFLYEVSKLMVHDVDGLLINLPALTRRMIHRAAVTDNDMLQILPIVAQATAGASAKTFKLAMLAPNSTRIIAEATKLMPLAKLIVSRLPDSSIVEAVTTAESGRMITAPKRGRKPKKLH